MIDASKKVRVYFNLHKNLFSVQQKNNKGNWVVVAHKFGIALKDLNFKVSEAGRQRVLKEKKKNVHAFIEGFVDNNFAMPPRKFHQVHYNPYKFDSFFTFQKADSVFLSKEPIPVKCSKSGFLIVEQKKPEIYAFDVDFDQK